MIIRQVQDSRYEILFIIAGMNIQCILIEFDPLWFPLETKLDENSIHPSELIDLYYPDILEFVLE
jgi:hypothetical protein